MHGSVIASASSHENQATSWLSSGGGHAPVLGAIRPNR